MTELHVFIHGCIFEKVEERKQESEKNQKVFIVCTPAMEQFATASLSRSELTLLLAIFFVLRAMVQAYITWSFQYTASLMTLYITWIRKIYCYVWLSAFLKI